jgi:hypothetical protein
LHIIKQVLHCAWSMHRLCGVELKLSAD